MPGTCLLTMDDTKLLPMPYFHAFQLKETKGRFGFSPIETKRKYSECYVYCDDYGSFVLYFFCFENFIALR